MTKKDFELIASCLNRCHKDMSLDEIIYLLSETLASKNPRFNREKFLQACGVEIEKNDYYYLTSCNYCKQRMEGYKKDVMDLVRCKNCNLLQ